MSIEDTNVVDFVGIDKIDGSLKMSISDHLDWSDEEKHLRLLQNKLNAYLDYIESGQAYEMYPSAKTKKVTVELIAKNNLSDLGNQLFEKFKKYYKESGYTLEGPKKCADKEDIN